MLIDTAKLNIFWRFKNMEKITLYCGLNDKDSKKQEINTIDAYKIAVNVVLKYCGGATILEADGIYTHENGEIIIEKTLKIELIDIDNVSINSIISELKTVFNQESILKQREIVTSEFC